MADILPRSSWCLQQGKLFLVVTSGVSFVFMVLAAFFFSLMKRGQVTFLYSDQRSENQTSFSLVCGRPLEWRSKAVACGSHVAMNELCGFISLAEKWRTVAPCRKWKGLLSLVHLWLFRTLCGVWLIVHTQKRLVGWTCTHFQGRFWQTGWLRTTEVYYFE